ncbi:hypothetical protein [Lacrimispora sp. JR3]|uniref:hypothetical protein n=1 Tax=Lacrimispora sinapis TaxID=3111456 RepID=UPI0037488D86
MILPDEFINRGFSIQEAGTDDLGIYIDIRRACCKNDADQYYGGWNDEIQTIISTDSFHRMLQVKSIYKILQEDRIIGFFSFTEQKDRIGDVSIYLLPHACETELEVFFIHQLTSRSEETGKPVIITVLRSSPLKELFERAGFEIYDKSKTHYLMSYNQKDPKETNSYMNRIYIKSQQ